jgi:uncharacterized protein (DUF1015 family)
MASIFPFHALRYNPSKVSINDVVTQPYDKITPSMQDRYYGASPYNLVRVILGKPMSGDNEQQSVYTRAAESLEEWKKSQVLVRDREPSIYLYTQTFRLPGETSGETLERRGFIALGQLEDYDRKVVFRHEQTLSKPKADRLNVLKATQAHFGQLFMLYSDPTAEIEHALRQDAPPTAEVRDEYDVVHRIWKISDPQVIRSVQEKMADKKLIIADGHHRYETALNYRNAMRSQHGTGASEPYERVMMTFVNMDSAGLVILPTHRVVFGLENFSLDQMISKLQENFDVKDLGAPSNFDAAMKQLHNAGNAGTALLAVTGDKTYLLRAHGEQKSRNLIGLSEKQCALDVVQLHKLILEEALGMSEEDIREQKHLKYIRAVGEALGEVRRGANIAFLLNPIPIEQMRDIAFAGEVLPQKSTDFYPKMLSGLTIYELEEAAEFSATGGH